MQGPCGARSGSMRDPFGVRSRSVRNPFEVRSGSVRNPFGIYSESVRNPFGVLFIHRPLHPPPSSSFAKVTMTRLKNNINSSEKKSNAHLIKAAEPGLGPHRRAAEPVLGPHRRPGLGGLGFTGFRVNLFVEFKKPPAASHRRPMVLRFGV